MDDNTWSHLWTPVSQDGMCGWVTTIGEAEAVRKAFERKKSITYVSGKKECNFGKVNIEINVKSRVRFHDIGETSLIPFNGMPFMIIGRYERNCLYGKDKHQKMKREKRDKRAALLKGDPNIQKKYRYSMQRTKKRNCPAKIIMKDVIFFPDYQVKEDTEKRRRRCSENLRDDLSDKLVHNKLRRIYILLPKDEDHQSTHPVNQDHQSTHPVNQDHQSTHTIDQDHQSTHPVNQVHQSTHPIGLDHQSTHPVNQVHQSTHPIGLDHQSTHPIDQDHQSTHPIGQDHQSTHPIGLDHQSTHPIGQDHQSSYPIGLDHQSTHPIGQDHQSSYPIGLDHQSTHPIGQVNIKFNQVSGTITTDGLADEEDIDEERHCETVPVLDVDITSVKGIPGSKLRVLAIRCREKLSVIQNATYVCQEESTMEHLYKILDKAATCMSSTLQRDDDFIKTPVVKVKKRKRLIVI